MRCVGDRSNNEHTYPEEDFDESIDPRVIRLGALQIALCYLGLGAGHDLSSFMGYDALSTSAAAIYDNTRNVAPP